MPRYLRFAQALALLSAPSVLSGCYLSHERPVDAPIDAALSDTLTDACTEPGCECRLPRSCTCPTLGSPGTCSAVGLEHCCPIVGPLSPPDLPA